MRPAGLVRELNIYPLKSCQRQSLKEMNITVEGLEGDRKWLVIDENGAVLSRRILPKLATVQVMSNDMGLNLGLGKQFFVVPKSHSLKRVVKVKIGNEDVEAALEPDLFSQALSQYLGVNCRLVRLGGVRPLSLLNTKSFNTPAEIESFRGNVIFEGSTAFEEHNWQKIRIGDVVFSQPKKYSQFGVLWIPENTGRISLGSPLEILM